MFGGASLRLFYMGTALAQDLARRPSQGRSSAARGWFTWTAGSIRVQDRDYLVGRSEDRRGHADRPSVLLPGMGEVVAHLPRRVKTRRPLVGD